LGIRSFLLLFFKKEVLPLIRLGRLVASGLFFATLYGTGIIMCLYALAIVRGDAPRMIALAQRWGRFNLRALAALCGVRVKFEGAEHVPNSGILAAQHQSELDILVLLAKLSRPTFVFKQELLTMPLFGACLCPAGMIPVDRDGGASAIRAMVTAGRAALAVGRQVVIFPQGTRIAPGVRGVIHPGVTALAAITGAGVVPVTVDSGRCWGAKGFVIMPGVVTVRVLPGLAPGLARKDLLAALAGVYYG
jgi:1-acyl-sn-glycerol-3-phosphate acyltransferase